MRSGIAGLVLALGWMTPAVWAQSQSDVVWPTYNTARYSTDPTLDCAALAAETAHVTADVGLLHKAQTRVEDVLHSAFDMERYGGSNGPGGTRVSAGVVHGKEAYVQARGQIAASLRVAQARRDYLKGLEPACKPAPQPVAAP